MIARCIQRPVALTLLALGLALAGALAFTRLRSEEHTSELQSH